VNTRFRTLFQKQSKKMNSNVVTVAKSPLASARAAPMQFVILPRAIIRRALHIAGKLDTTDSTAVAI